MYKGKKTCKILKEIRKQIAEKNDIAFVTSECRHQGDCAGTCPACEAEVRYLEQELRRRQQLGKVAVVAGLSVGLLAGLPGCNTPATPDAAPANTTQTQGNERPDTSASLRIIPEADSATPSFQDEVPLQGVVEKTNDIIDVPTKSHKVNLPTETSGNNTEDELIFGDVEATPVEVFPVFPGGMEALQAFLSKELIYPEGARVKGISGMVLVGFFVDEDGQISNIETIFSPDPELSRAAVEAVKKMPRWEPAQSEDGKPISSFCQIPITFKLD